MVLLADDALHQLWRDCAGRGGESASPRLMPHPAACRRWRTLHMLATRHGSHWPSPPVHSRWHSHYRNPALPPLPQAGNHYSNYSEFLRQGGRGLDTALGYTDPINHQIAAAIKAHPEIPRSEIFVTSKLPCREINTKNPEMNGKMLTFVLKMFGFCIGMFGLCIQNVGFCRHCVRRSGLY